MSGKRDLNPRPSPWQGAHRLWKFGNLAISERAGRAIRARRAIRAPKNASEVHQVGLMHFRAGDVATLEVVRRTSPLVTPLRSPTRLCAYLEQPRLRRSRPGRDSKPARATDGRTRWRTSRRERGNGWPKRSTPGFCARTMLLDTATGD